MLTDTFDIQAKFTRICGAIATQILFESKSPVFKKKKIICFQEENVIVVTKMKEEDVLLQ